MKINVKTLKLNLNDSTIEKLESKLAKFDRLMGENAVADVTFKTQKDRVFLEIAIYSGDMIIRAESDDEDANLPLPFKKQETAQEDLAKSQALYANEDDEEDEDKDLPITYDSFSAPLIH